MIRAEKTRSIVRIVVEDSGQGLQGESGSGVGMTNVQKRLSTLYGDRAKFLLEDNVPHGLRITIEVPYDNH